MRLCVRRMIIILCTVDFFSNGIHRYQSYKETKGDFTKIWTIVIDRHTLWCMVTGENDTIYGWSDEVIIMSVTWHFFFFWIMDINCCVYSIFS